MTEILLETLENKVEMWQNAAHALIKSALSTSNLKGKASEEQFLQTPNQYGNLSNRQTHTHQIKIEAKTVFKMQ